MKFSNILLTALFASASVITVIAGRETTNGAINVFAALCILCTICAGNLLREDVQVANKRRKRRAMAVKMAGYTQLRSGAWEKNTI